MFTNSNSIWIAHIKCLQLVAFEFLHLNGVYRFQQHWFLAVFTASDIQSFYI